VPEIKQRMLDAGCTAPLISDFRHNGHLLLTKYPDCARALDEMRINPGNVGTGRRRDEGSSRRSAKSPSTTAGRVASASAAVRSARARRREVQENTDRSQADVGERSSTVHGALGVSRRSRSSGLRKDQIIISCGTWRRDLIAIYQALARQTDQPRIWVSEAGMGTKASSGRRRRWAAVERGIR
jgi:(E)-4-hydroxy-3-methylbut-2-enyl-diphosphate synthase